MADEGAGLGALGTASVEVVADTSGLRRGFQQARQETQQATQAMASGFAEVRQHVTHTARALFGLRGTIGSVFAAVAIQQATVAARGLADSIEDIGIRAKTVGLTAQEYQKLTYAARQADVSTEELNTALAFFAKGLGQAQAGVGPLVETLKRIDPELAKQIKTAKTMQEAINIAADAVESLSSAQDRAAVVTNLFGRSGIGMSRLFGEGAASLREAGNEAERLGQVLSNADLAAGGELSDAFTEAAAAIRTEFMRALIELAPIITDTINSITGLVRSLKEIGGAVAERNMGAWKEQAKGLREEIAGVEGKLIDMQNLAQNGNAFQRFFAEGQINEASAKLSRLQGQLDQVDKKILAGSLPESNKATKDDMLEPKRAGRRLAPTVDEKETKEAQDKLRAFREKYLQETEQFSQLALMQQAEELKGFKEMLDKKLITQEEFEQVRVQLADLTSRRMKEAFEKEFKDTLEVVRAVGDGIEDEFGNWVETGEFNAQEMVRRILVQIAKLQFAQAMQPLFGGGDTKGGGIIGGLLAGLTGRGAGGWSTQIVSLHSGGKVGSAGRWSTGDPSLWAGAPKLHSGLLPGEYRAILKQGETVLPEGMGLGGNSTKVEVHNYSGAPVQEERSRSGNTDLVKLVIGSVKEGMGRGDFDGVMRGRYGTGVTPRRT